MLYDDGGARFNFDKRQFRNARKALNQVRNGTGRATLLFGPGDSTTRGDHTGPADGLQNNNNLAQNCHPYRTMQLLKAAGIPVTMDGIFGASAYVTVADANTLDPTRFSLGADWYVSPVSESIGGTIYYQLAGGVTPWSYAPAVASDTAVILYPTQTAGGTFSVKQGGVVVATVSTVGAAGGVGKVIVRGSLGLATWSIQWASGASYQLCGAYFYNSAVPAVDCINGGYSGSTSGFWAGAMAGVVALQPNLAEVNLGINDWRTGASPAAYSSNMQTIYSALAGISCDFYGLVPWPSESTVYSPQLQASYIAELYTLALSNNFPLVDLTYLEGSWETANALGYCFDDLHPNQLGAWEQGAPGARLILSI